MGSVVSLMPQLIQDECVAESGTALEYHGMHVIVCGSAGSGCYGDRSLHAMTRVEA